MATRVGWLGVSNGVMGYIGEVVHGRWPISASSDGLYVSTSYVPTKFNTYLGYWTINTPQLTLAPDEVPVKITMNTYEPKGDSYFYNNYNSPYGGPSPTLYLSNGSGTDFGAEQVIVSGSSFLENTAAITGTIPESIRSNYAGKPLSVSYWNSNSDVMLRGHVKITVDTLYISPAISYSNGHGGKATGATSANRGQSITVTVTPDTGYKLASITANVGKLTKVNDNQYTYTMATPGANATITTTFALADYSISTNVSPASAGTVTTNVSKAHYNDEITATCATASGEYYLTGWIINSGLSAQAYTTNDHVYKFKMPASNVNVTAVHLQHKIEWENAVINAVQDSENVTLTYSGTCTDNFSRPLKFYIYRDGNLMYATKEGGVYVPDGTQTTPLEVAAPSLEEQSIVVQVSSEDVDKEIRFSIVAHDDQGITSGGATVSLNVQYINRTVGYYIKDGSKGKWVECVPYYCVDRNMLAESLMLPTPQGAIFKFGFTTSDGLKPSTTYVIATPYVLMKLVANGEIIYQWTEHAHLSNLTVDYKYYVGTGSAQTGSGELDLLEGTYTFTTPANVNKIELTITAGPSGDFADVVPDYKNWFFTENGIELEWVEVEPYYYDANNGWQLCSLN